MELKRISETIYNAIEGTFNRTLWNWNVEAEQGNGENQEGF